MLQQFRAVVLVKFLTDNSLGLYLHIPFCAKKCAYCDFYSAFQNEDSLDSFVNKLIEEINIWGGRLNRPISTIYFGGGTPSLLGDRIVSLIDAVRGSFDVKKDAEITLELNPASDSDSMFKAAKKAGVNRLSIGAQSGDNKMLSLLGRTHTAEDTERAVNSARALGFNNISLDLMIGLPSSDLDTLKSDMDFILSLKPEHISAYILKIEENTYFAKIQDTLNLPDEDSVAEQYDFMCRYFTEKGYNHYEISNFSLKDKESQHNLKYWQCEEYLGIGPSAHSFLEGERFFYPRDLKAFLSGNSPLTDGKGGEAEEFIMLNLRLKQGLNFKDYRKKYGFDIKEKINNISPPLINAGYINLDNEKIALNDKGMAVSNSVILHILESLE